MRITAVGRAFPKHYYNQGTLLAAFKRVWADRLHTTACLGRLHRNVLVQGRHLALSVEEYDQLDSFAKRNDAFIRCGVDLGAQAITDALEAGGLAPRDVDHVFSVSVTGVAVPSIDARLVNRLRLRPDIKRTPIFGLGCVAGSWSEGSWCAFRLLSPHRRRDGMAHHGCGLSHDRLDL